MGGYKGVLAVDTSIDGDSIHQIQFRPSMRKFKTSHFGSLDIIRPSLYAPAYLNHQIITLLSSMRIADNVFLSLQRAMQRRFDDIFFNPSIAIATLTPFAAESDTLKIVIKMIRAGLSLINEPFMNNILRLFQSSKLKEVKYKARILVPQGVQLMGVCVLW
jgi:RNA-dependent RNA polymerase